MSLHIARFIDKLKAAESRGARDIVMSLNEARDLHADITKLLLAVKPLKQPTQEPVIEVQIDGGKF